MSTAEPATAPKLDDYPGLEKLWHKKYWPKARGGIECICSPTLEFSDIRALDLDHHPELVNTLHEIAKTYLPHCVRKMELFVARSKLECAGTSSAGRHGLPKFNEKPVSGEMDAATFTEVQKIYKEIEALDDQLAKLNRASLATLKDSEGFQHAVQHAEKDEFGFPLVSENSANKFFGDLLKFCSGAAREYIHDRNRDVYQIDKRFYLNTKEMGMIIPRKT